MARARCNARARRRQRSTEVAIQSLARSMTDASNYHYRVQSFLIRWGSFPPSGSTRRTTEVFEAIRQQLAESSDDVVVALSFLA